MQKLAKKYQMVLVVPVYEVEMTGVYFNTAAVIDADGRYLGNTASTTFRTVTPGFGKSFISRRERRLSRFPDALCPRRRLHLLRPPLPGRCAHPRPQWRGNRLQPVCHRRWSIRISLELEQPAHAVANAYFVAAINRVGTEAPWKSASFTARAISATRAVKLSPRPAVTRTSCSCAELNLDEIQESSRYLAVLSRPPPGILRRNHAHTGRNTAAAG